MSCKYHLSTCGCTNRYSCLISQFILFSLECQEENQLGNNADTVVTVNGTQINHDDLFDFDFRAPRYCVPTDTSPPTLTILFSSSILLTEIGIRGSPGLLPLQDQFVKSFSLSYAVGGHFTTYTRANGLTVCSIRIVVSFVLYLS